MGWPISRCARSAWRRRRITSPRRFGRITISDFCLITSALLDVCSARSASVKSARHRFSSISQSWRSRRCSRDLSLAHASRYRAIEASFCLLYGYSIVWDRCCIVNPCCGQTWRLGGISPRLTAMIPSRAGELRANENAKTSAGGVPVRSRGNWPQHNYGAARFGHLSSFGNLFPTTGIF